MVEKYSAEFWELDSLLDSTQYDRISDCVSLLEHQLNDFDDRNETEHSSSFETLIQASFVMAAVAHMEHGLKKICDIIAVKRNLVIRATDMKGANGFESCVAYLNKVLTVRLPKDELKVVRAILQLRNSWVHQGGYLDKVPSNLGGLAGHVEKAADGQLQLAAPLVQKVCRICQSFEGAVVSAISADYAPWEKTKRQPEHK